MAETDPVIIGILEIAKADARQEVAMTTSQVIRLSTELTNARINKASAEARLESILQVIPDEPESTEENPST